MANHERVVLGESISVTTSTEAVGRGEKLAVEFVADVAKKLEEKSTEKKA